MNRYYLLFLLVALCTFQSVTSEEDQNEVDKETIQGELKDSHNNVIDEKEEEEDDEEGEEVNDEMEVKHLSADLPFHPVNDVADSLLQEFLVRSRRPACSNRKCLRWYQGYWAPQCNGEKYRAIAYCQTTGMWCCGRCEPKQWCTRKGGFCSVNCPPDYITYTNGCFAKWKCCVPTTVTT